MVTENLCTCSADDKKANKMSDCIKNETGMNVEKYATLWSKVMVQLYLKYCD